MSRRRTKHSYRTRLKCSTKRALRPSRVRAIMVPLPMPASQETAQKRMTQAPNADAVIVAFSEIPSLLEAAPALITSGRFLDCDCRLGAVEQPFFVAIRAGRIVEFSAKPALMRSWRFSYRATPQAWSEYWKPMPKPGFHDLLALTKRGEAVLEGELHPFMTHLQHFKDLLALPRFRQPKAAARREGS